MRRRTFDLLASTVGLLLTVVLIIAGALLMWAYTFVNSQVHDQLAAQKIFFPAANSAEITALPAADATAMKQYAGQLMVNGAQAQTYANNFIAVHLLRIGGGKTYSQLSQESLANPKNAALAAKTSLVFRGTTLRGLLLNAYAFWQIGQIALVASIVAFAAALLMLILVGLGFWHLRRTPQEQRFAGG